MSEHTCNCKYVGCHINDCRRWCHFLNKEIPYEFCNEYCTAYVEIYDEDLENASVATCEKYSVIGYDRYDDCGANQAAIKYCLENLI